MSQSMNIGSRCTSTEVVRSSSPSRRRAVLSGHGKFTRVTYSQGAPSFMACAGEGFVVDKIFGAPPEANLGHFDEAQRSNDMATFDLEEAAAFGKKDLHLGFPCVRPRAETAPSINFLRMRGDYGHPDRKDQV